MQTFAAELVRLAQAQDATPEQREEIADALKAALAVVEARSSTRELAELALANLAEHLTCAAEHVDFLREVIRRPPG